MQCLNSPQIALNQEFEFGLKVMKMLILIFFKSCYRCFPSIWTASKWCLEWFWTRKLDLLVQVLKIGSLCDETHFHEVLESDFELGWFWDDEDVPNSSGTSFRVCLSAHLVDLAMVSRNGMFCTFYVKWWDFEIKICFRLGLWCL